MNSIELIKRTMFFEGYFKAIDDIYKSIYNEALVDEHEKYRQVKIKPIKEQLRKLAIKYKNNPKIHEQIEKINDWVNDNLLTVSITTLASISCLLDASFINIEVLSKTAAILSLPNTARVISKKIIKYAEEVEEENK